ncbi:MAG: GH116 family glycosyl hydrolase [Armatimonadetes bacterium]|nr:GH116 family glycosyl hydrolase [Armatimonadota bacterium]
MAYIHQQIYHNSGIPLGGIGTGSVEIRPDGLFHEWHMFNFGQWNPGSPCRCAEAMGPEDLVFMVRTEDSSGQTLVRYLALREELHDLYSLAWARCVTAIHFEGTFPIATLVYEDPALPVEIEAEVFSPFVPLDSRTSGTPGFYVRFSIRNLADSNVEVSIMGVMRNAVGWCQDRRVPRNRLEEIDSSLLSSDGQGRQAKAIWMTADKLRSDHSTTGDMTFACQGSEVTHITGSFREDHRAMRFFRFRYGYRIESFLHQFREDGRLPNLNAETPPQLAKGLSASRLGKSERERLLGDLLQYPAFYDKYQRLRRVDPEIVESPEFLDELIDHVAELREREIEWGWSALCSRMEIAPESQSETLFAVGWFFPNHISATGENIGHMYGHWFSNSLDVVRFLLSGYGDLRDRTSEFVESIHYSSLPEEAADAVTSQLTTLIKCTWWTKSGHFGVWEGYGCCGFHTTDITYQGSFPIIALFPDLQKMQMTHGARFQREDGRVHHFFTPDFSAVDDGFDRVDMNQQFVMLAARDYLWTGDRDYLKTLWPHIVRAMDNTALLDTDGDGLPDTDTRRNTYDAWDFTGCPSYISSLWLGALKAAVRLANEVGDKERAAQWESAYQKGVASFESRLWNGEYYVLWRDGDEIDECCMSDQISGDWFAAACGWGSILHPDRIKMALGAIIRYNFRWSEGLINASYPPGKKRRVAASDNMQAEAPWTGIEYTVASLLIDYGMVAEGMAIVRDIHERYMQAGRYWSHVECGSHYYRAMSSWSVLLALSGFRWDQPTGAITFAPAIDEPSCEYPFFCGIAWGQYYQESSLGGRCVVIDLTDGELTVSSLRLPKLSGFDSPTVIMGERKLPCQVEKLGEGICILFSEPIKLTPANALVVTS